MSQPLFFRTATLEDLPSLMTLINTAYKALARESWAVDLGLPDLPRVTHASLTRDLTSTTSCIVVGFIDDTPVVCAQLDEEDDGEGYFGMFAVAPTHQGLGLGRRMLEEAERRHAASGRTRLRLAVIRPRTHLFDWYERFGFQCTGDTRTFHPGEDIAPLPMDMMEKPLLAAA